MKRISIIVIIGTLIVVSGCGVYTFSPKGKSNLSSIAVDRFENRTPEYGIEDAMTDQIIDAFIANGNLKVVSRENADAVLTGVLTGYSRRPYDPDENDQVQSYAVTMNFDIALTNPDDNTEIWADKLNQIGVYRLDSQTEEDGRQEAIGLLVEAIINKTTKSW